MSKDNIHKCVAECCRLLLGVVFSFSGTVKAIDPMGGSIKINDYLTAFGLEGWKWMSLPLSFNLSALEFMLGICLLLGVYRKYTTFLILLFMLCMTPLTLYLAIFNPVSDCGCFGDALVITNWQTFYKNIVLLAAAIYVFIHHKHLSPFYTFHVYWLVAIWAYGYAIFFAYHNYNHLPLLDFRPYKVGANITDLISIPEGAPEDEYAYSFTYEKDGVQKTFSLENAPMDDSLWVFVDAKTELIRQGYVPPVTDFHIYDETGDREVTEELLAEPRNVFLLIAPRLEEADDTYIDEINNAYDYAMENDMLFYGVTSSSSMTIDDWSAGTGAEYPFLMADDVLLKTIIRSNPGLVLLQKGTILMKWHVHDIPKEEDLPEVVANCLEGNTQWKTKEDARLISNLLTFALPLLLVWGYDRGMERIRRRKTKKND